MSHPDRSSKPIAILPDSELVPLVEVVTIMVLAEHPALTQQPEPWRSPEWERYARPTRSVVLQAAQSGALKVHRRGSYAVMDFDKNEFASFNVEVTDLRQWLEGGGFNISAGPPADPLSTATEATPQERRKSQRQDALSVELDAVLTAMRAAGGRMTATAVFAQLKKRAGQMGQCVVDVAGDGSYLIWESSTGKSHQLSLAALAKRIAGWGRKNTPLSTR